MNIQLKPDNRVEDCEAPEEWKHWQRHVFPAIVVPTVRIRPIRAITRTGSIPHGGHTTTKSLAVSSESRKVNSMLELRRSENEEEILIPLQGNLEALDVLFSRYRDVLSFVAYRVLGDHNLAEDAVQRCFLSASRNIGNFESEGAFRSWLVRVLIDEALLILQEREWVARTLGIDQRPELSDRFRVPKVSSCRE